MFGYKMFDLQLRTKVKKISPKQRASYSRSNKRFKVKRRQDLGFGGGMMGREGWWNHRWSASQQQKTVRHWESALACSPMCWLFLPEVSAQVKTPSEVHDCLRFATLWLRMPKWRRRTTLMWAPCQFCRNVWRTILRHGISKPKKCLGLIWALVLYLRA